jgi:type IV pilus assembly protein PilY1
MESTMRTTQKNKLNFVQRLARRAYPLMFAFMATMLALPSTAGIVLPDEPLVTGARIPPNVLFVLDNSGSMAELTMPDTIASVSGVNIANETYVRNVIYYNPNKTYLPWLDSTGTVMTGGTAYNNAYSHVDLVAPFNTGTVNLYDSVQNYYIPKDPADSSTFGNVANYWRYQILTNGTVQRSEWDASAIVDNVATGYPITGLVGITGSFNTAFPVFTVPANTVRVRVTATNAGAANLFTRVGSAPTTGTYTSRVNNNNATKTIDRNNPAAGEVIYVGLQGKGVGFAGLTLTITYQLNDPGCSGYGWVNCTNVTPTGRSEADERQNFSTWYSYHRSRMKVAKAGAGRAFAEIGTNYRVGYRNIWNNMPNSGSSGGVAWGTHPITRTKPIPVTRNNGLFDDPNGATGADNNRTAWYQRLYSQVSSGATPLRQALWNSGNYYATDHTNTGPWGPEATADQYACRQNFTILTTDGYRNDDSANTAGFDYTGAGQQVGEQDNVAGATITSPAGASFTYSPVAPFASAHSNTLADIAMYYWKTDLRDDLLNVVQPSSANPAFWQHMATFAISIGAQGTLNPDTDLPNMVAGTPWPQPLNLQPTSIDDLWHAAVNGRGTFTVATDPDAFSNALKGALANIAERTGSFSNVAANSTSLDAGTRVFQANYVSGVWTGQLNAFPVTQTVVGGVTVRSVSASPSWQATSGIPLVATRKIFSSNGTAGTQFPSGATTAQLAALTRTLDFPVSGADNAAYIAGARNQEIANGGTLRDRAHLMGDIVGSSPAYAKETDTVYVGANDGMLHAIDASSGQELFTFIPNIINWGHLRDLSSPEYLHRYFVDGPIVVSNHDQTPGDNILVGALGKGGKGLYALDVTDPDTFGTANFKWEVAADNNVATTADNNIGLIQSKPIIAKLNNGVTALIVSNGVNSTNDRAVLLVYNLDTGALIREIDTGQGSTLNPNGLSGPAGWDADGNGTLDYVYAGDLLGNVWKFNLSSTATASWSVANSGNPLFTATDSSSNPQPINGGMSVAMHPTTFQTWIFFGTGRFMTAGDLVDESVQSYYGMVDDGTVIVRNGGSANLTQRSISVVGFRDGKPVRGFAENSPLPAGSKGWFVDLVPPSPGLPEGERIVTEGQVVNDVLVFASVIPTSEACDPNGRGYLNALDAFTGTSTRPSYFDTNNDGNFDNDTVTGGGVTVPIGSVDLGVGMPTLPGLLQGLAVVSGSGGGTGSVMTRDSRNVGRVSWREVIRN